MKAPKVSVIIPAYNSEQFIEETIDSVLSQSYKDFEIIIVDDESCDRTSSIISRYKNRLIYIRKENEGLSIARNTGIARAQGEYVAFIDHDDIWLPKKLEEQIALLEANKQICLCFSDAYIIDENGRQGNTLFRISSPYRGMVFKQLLRENFIPVLTAVVRKEVFKEIGFFDPRYKIAEDWDFFLRLSSRYPATFIDRPLAKYRVHDRSVSRQKDVMLTESVNIINKYIQFVDKDTKATVRAKKRRLEFELGIIYLYKGLKSKARDHFLTKVKTEFFSFCFYIGLLLTYLPDSCIKFIRQVLLFKRLHSNK